MSKEICTISIPRGTFDNDYTIFDDGKILHYYDRNTFDLNIREWIRVSEIDMDTKKEIVDKCPEEFKKQIKDILFGQS